MGHIPKDGISNMLNIFTYTIPLSNITPISICLFVSIYDDVGYFYVFVTSCNLIILQFGKL